jgi:hypothetical protein
MPTISELVVKITGDTSDLTKKTTEAGNNLSAFGDKAIDVGKKMSIGITLPAIAAGTAMVKLASDTGESLNAASVVFGKSTSVISAWGKNAAEQAGLTSAEFYQASAVIGAGLINAGASAEIASEQTIELTKRAADMASIFNTSVNDAMLALQSGLRGESEPLRRFAVSLDEATVSARASAMGLVDADGAVTSYGKSQARLAIIMEQSARFQGDFTNTSDQLANKTRIVTAQIKEQASELGQKLLPLVLDAVSAAGELVKKFSDLSSEQKETILKTVAVAAAVGPMLIVVGKATKAISSFSTAFKLLSAAGGGPVAIAIAGITAIGTATGIFVGNLKDAQTEFKNLQTVMGGGTTGTIARDLGIVNEEIATLKARISSSEGLLPDETKQLEKELAAVQAIRQRLVAKIQAQGMSAQAAASVVKQVEAEALTAKEIEAIAKRKAEAEKKYTDARTQVLAILESEKSEYEKIQDQIEALEKTPWATGELEKDRQEALFVLRNQQSILLKEEEDERLALVKKIQDAEDKARDEKLAKEKKLYADIIANVEYAMQASQSAFTAIGESLVTGKDLWGSFASAAIKSIAGIIKALGDELAAKAAARLVEAFAAAASILLAPAAPGLFSSAGILAGGAATAWASAGALSAYADSAFARGTDFAPGGMAAVNEEGPEIMNIPRGTSIIPATRTQAGSTGGGNTFIINSPKAVTPSEAAQQYTRMVRNLAFEGVL